MQEKEYAQVSNKQNLWIMMQACRDILPGTQWGVDDAAYIKLAEDISNMFQKVQDSISVDEDDDKITEEGD